MRIPSLPDIARWLPGSAREQAAADRQPELAASRAILQDAETGLPHRLALETALAEMRLAAPEGVYAAAIGVERFGRLRATIGYDLALEALRALGGRLVGLVDGRAARLSTGVLGVAFEAPDDEAAAAWLVMLLRELEAPLQIGRDSVTLVLAAGFSGMAYGESGKAALGQAMNGLDQARAGRRKLAKFDAEGWGDPSANLALMSGMLWALRAGHVELHHQPKYDLRARTITATEGLVRWRHPTRGLLSPGLFIPLAEETGHIRTLTDWVVRQAIADQAKLARLGHRVEVSVNISGRVLIDSDFADFVDRAIGEAVGKLTFEITEAAVLESPEAALGTIARFRAAGVGVCIDDYGSGMSSLAGLKQIQADELKIDRSLVAAITEGQRDALVLRSAIDLAHGLGLKVTAEGVETADAFQMLAAMGCDSAQGFLIARPMPLAELMGFFAEGSDLRRSFA